MFNKLDIYFDIPFGRKKTNAWCENNEILGKKKTDATFSSLF